MTFLKETGIIKEERWKTYGCSTDAARESEANFENYWTGWLDVSLTEKGQEQARKAGKIKTRRSSLTLHLRQY